MENTSLTRSLSKVKSKLSSKFRIESADEEHVLKAMKYESTSTSQSNMTSSATSMPSLNASMSTNSIATSALASPPLPPSGVSSPLSQRQNSYAESRSSSIIQMESIPENMTSILLSEQQDVMPTTSSNNNNNTSSHKMELQPSFLPSEQTAATLQQSSRKTSLDDKQDDQVLEQLLPPPPMCNVTSPRITTDLSSPFGPISPPISPGSIKLRNGSIVCDPLEGLVAVMSPTAPLTTSVHPNDFADAMALSILDKIDENTDSKTEWKI